MKIWILLHVFVFAGVYASIDNVAVNSKNGMVTSNDDKTDEDRPKRELENVISIVGSIAEGIGAGASLVDGGVSLGKLALAISDEIHKIIERSESRDGFIQGLLYEIEFDTGDLCNCVIYSLKKKFTNKLTGIKYYKRYEYNGEWFGVWLAEAGSFANNEIIKIDKWGFAGAQSGLSGIFKDTVEFSYRPCPTTPDNKVSRTSEKKDWKDGKSGPLYFPPE